MPNALLDVLETWAGRTVTQAALEERGFMIHRAWQDNVLQLCMSEERADLQRFWDESTREIVASGGRADPRNRWFGSEHRYRSAHIDALAAKQDSTDIQPRRPHIVRVLDEYWKKTTDPGWRALEVAAYEKLKKHEIRAHNISVEGWTGYKRDVVPILTRYATEKGYVSKRGVFQKIVGELAYCMQPDLGGNPLIVAQNPLRFHIHHQSSRKNIFEILSMDMFIPGFSRYTYGGGNSNSHALGILASMELLEVLSHTFKTTSRRSA